jgi:metal-dependent amidase/aminoacylase/carboxypeptidase family protein
VDALPRVGVPSVFPRVESRDVSFPGCFLTLGVGTADDGMPYQNHHPKFDVHEAALADGTRTEVQIVLDILGS